MSTPFGAVADAKYVYLTTFRKDGTPVGTPLWATMDGDRMVLWTPTDSWKVKRIRKNPRVSVQACTMRGERSGPVVEGTAVIVEGDGAGRIRRLISGKYGVLGWLTVTGSIVRRGGSGTCGIVVTAD